MKSDLQFILLANSQRSGSTLVQRILNQRQDLFMWGENGSFLDAFLGLHANALAYSRDSAPLRAVFHAAKSTAGVPDAVLARMQNLSPDEPVLEEAMLASLREYVSTMLAHPRFQSVGFKYVNAEEAHARLCVRAWATVPVLLVLREPGAAFGSLPAQWRAAASLTPDAFAARWAKSATAFLELARADMRFHLIEYEGLVGGGASYRRLLATAGIGAEQARPALELRLNPTAKSERASPEEVEYVTRVCRATYEAVKAYADAG